MATKNKKQGDKHKFGFGEKTIDFLEKKTRQAVEDNSEAIALYFELDYEASHTNFYGELLIKQFKNPLGLNVRGIINVEELSASVVEGIPNQITQLTFTVYINELKELNISPKIGDYFAYKTRYYLIFRKLIADANKATIGTALDPLYTIFYCQQADDEQIFSDSWGTPGDDSARNSQASLE
jgi:hypothetical protein